MAVSNKEWQSRLELAEKSCEDFRSTLRAAIPASRAVEPEEVVQAFNDLIDMARAMGREEERRREKLYEAVITYGKPSKVVKQGPTGSRDSVASLAKAWQESHASLMSKGEGPVHSVEIRPYVEEDESP